MGEVYRSRGATLERDVAIKVVPEAVARDCECFGRFEREARLLASLKHPNVVVIPGSGEAGEGKFFLLEYVEGERLAGRLECGQLAVDGLKATVRRVLATVHTLYDLR